MRLTNTLCFFLIVLLTACSGSSLVGRSRVLATVDGANLTLSATIEGTTGMSLSGAAVGVVDPGGAWQPIQFNTTQNAYVLRSKALTGIYTLEVNSAVPLENPILSVPVVVLSSSPEIIQVQDGLGNVAQEFKRLSAATPIRVTWKAIPEAMRYLLEVRQNSKSLLSLITQDTSAVIAPAVLEGSSLGLNTTVSIIASVSNGDPKFVTARFFSASSSSANVFTFQVIP